MEEEEREVGIESLNGKQKAAILMVALGPEVSSHILKQLSDVEIEELTREIALLHNVPPQLRMAVMEEFHQMMMAHSYILKGGLDYARQILEPAVGSRKAADILEKIQRSSLAADFSSLRGVDPAQLLSLLQKEHPQTIALILSQLDPNQAASILEELPKRIQVEVIQRIATMEQVSPDTLRAVKGILESRVDRTARGSRIGGVKAAADILNLVGQSVEREILEE